MRERRKEHLGRGKLGLSRRDEGGEPSRGRPWGGGKKPLFRGKEERQESRLKRRSDSVKELTLYTKKESSMSCPASPREKGSTSLREMKMPSFLGGGRVAKPIYKREEPVHASRKCRCVLTVHLRPRRAVLARHKGGRAMGVQGNNVAAHTILISRNEESSQGTAARFTSWRRCTGHRRECQSDNSLIA